MQTILTKRFHKYLKDNHPELVAQLEHDDKLTEFLSEKVTSAIALMKHLENEPHYIIEDACFELLIEELLPSKFNYILNILEEEFPEKYKQLQEAGILKFEVINMIGQCRPAFDKLHFSQENEDSSFVRSAITGDISNYFDSDKVRMKSDNGL